MDATQVFRLSCSMMCVLGQWQSIQECRYMPYGCCVLTSVSNPRIAAFSSFAARLVACVLERRCHSNSSSRTVWNDAHRNHVAPSWYTPTGKRRHVAHTHRPSISKATMLAPTADTTIGSARGRVPYANAVTTSTSSALRALGSSASTQVAYCSRDTLPAYPRCRSRW